MGSSAGPPGTEETAYGSTARRVIPMGNALWRLQTYCSTVKMCLGSCWLLSGAMDLTSLVARISCVRVRYLAGPGKSVSVAVSPKGEAWSQRSFSQAMISLRMSILCLPLSYFLKSRFFWLDPLVVLTITMLGSFCASSVWYLTLRDIGTTSGAAVHILHALNRICLIWWHIYEGFMCYV